MLPFIVAAFIVLGPQLRRAASRHDGRSPRGGRSSHAIHLVVVAFVVALDAEARAGAGLLTELGGAQRPARAVYRRLVALGAATAYRWLTYFPWGVLAFTYLFLTRLADCDTLAACAGSWREPSSDPLLALLFGRPAGPRLERPVRARPASRGVEPEPVVWDSRGESGRPGGKGRYEGRPGRPGRRATR